MLALRRISIDYFNQYTKFEKPSGERRGPVEGHTEYHIGLRVLKVKAPPTSKDPIFTDDSVSEDIQFSNEPHSLMVLVIARRDNEVIGMSKERFEYVVEPFRL